MLKCDFCEEENETVGFDPDWDAQVCDKCSHAMIAEMEKVQQSLRERAAETNGVPKNNPKQR